MMAQIEIRHYPPVNVVIEIRSKPWIDEPHRVSLGIATSRRVSYKDKKSGIRELILDSGKQIKTTDIIQDEGRPVFGENLFDSVIDLLWVRPYFVVRIHAKFGEKLANRTRAGTGLRNADYIPVFGF